MVPSYKASFKALGIYAIFGAAATRERHGGWRMDCVDWAPDVWKCSQKIATKIRPFRLDYMDVSENSGTPKSSILIGFFHYKPSILGYPYFWGNIHIWTLLFSSGWLRIWIFSKTMQSWHTCVTTRLEFSRVDDWHFGTSIATTSTKTVFCPNIACSFSLRLGGTIFRIKGILAVKNHPFKHVFHAVMDVSDEADAEPWGKDEKRITKIVFIGNSPCLKRS